MKDGDCCLGRPANWGKLVQSSKEAIEDFNDFASDKAIVWADNELKNYKRAMMLLANSNSNWAMGLTEEDEKFIQTMINRAEAGDKYE